MSTTTILTILDYPEQERADVPLLDGPKRYNRSVWGEEYLLLRRMLDNSPHANVLGNDLKDIVCDYWMDLEHGGVSRTLKAKDRHWIASRLGRIFGMSLFCVVVATLMRHTKTLAVPILTAICWTIFVTLGARRFMHCLPEQHIVYVSQSRCIKTAVILFFVTNYIVLLIPAIISVTTVLGVTHYDMPSFFYTYAIWGLFGFIYTSFFAIATLRCNVSVQFWMPPFWAMDKAPELRFIPNTDELLIDVGDPPETATARPITLFTYRLIKVSDPERPFLHDARLLEVFDAKRPFARFYCLWTKELRDILEKAHINTSLMTDVTVSRTYRIWSVCWRQPPPSEEPNGGEDVEHNSDDDDTDDEKDDNSVFLLR